jgi:DNA-binding YbaB/EbfC family protein
MFKGLSNLAQLMKQAHEAQARLEELKDRMGRLTVEGIAGGGLLSVQMCGNHKVLACRIDETLMRAEDREVVEDLVVAAVNDALRKLKEATAHEISELAGGLDLGVLKEALVGLGG